MIVLDCCAAVNIVRRTAEGRALEQLMLENERIISSELLFAELDSVFWKYVRAGYFTRKQAQEHIYAATRPVDEFIALSVNSVEAFSEAARLGHSPYDMFYFTLARRYGATLYTLDRSLIALCEREGIDCLHDLKLS